jgi:hypothetical protein
MIDAAEKHEKQEMYMGRRLFPAHIYEEDKVVMKGMLIRKLMDMKIIMTQCEHL